MTEWHLSCQLVPSPWLRCRATRWSSHRSRRCRQRALSGCKLVPTPSWTWRRSDEPGPADTTNWPNMHQRFLLPTFEGAIKDNRISNNMPFRKNGRNASGTYNITDAFVNRRIKHRIRKPDGTTAFRETHARYKEPVPTINDGDRS